MYIFMYVFRLNWYLIEVYLWCGMYSLDGSVLSFKVKVIFILFWIFGKMKRKYEWYFIFFFFFKN